MSRGVATQVRWWAVFWGLVLITAGCGGPEKEVRQKVVGLAEALVPIGEETLRDYRSRMAGLTQRELTDSVTVLSEWTEPGELSKEEVLDQLRRLRGAHAPTSLEVLEAEVLIGEPPKSAVVRGRLRVSTSQVGDLHAQHFPFEVYLERSRDWRVRRVTIEPAEGYLPEARP